MLAEAQQGGLFPLAPIRRQRVPCQNENPVYGLYRHEYFGYHPTCWRRFPAGWGCPSPEAPDAAASFAKRPRDPAIPVGVDDFGGPGRDRDEMDDQDPGMAPGPEGDQLPPVPEGRAPFQTDRPDAGAEPRPAPRQAPPAGPNSSPPNSSPFDLLPSPADTPSERPVSLPSNEAVPANDRDAALSLPEPAEAPALALPDPTTSAPATSSLAPSNPTPGPGASAFPASNPAQAPRRTSMLGSLFNRTRR